jgi:hypothetical protein
VKSWSARLLALACIGVIVESRQVVLGMRCISWGLFRGCGRPRCRICIWVSGLGWLCVPCTVCDTCVLRIAMRRVHGMRPPIMRRSLHAPCPSPPTPTRSTALHLTYRYIHKYMYARCTYERPTRGPHDPHPIPTPQDERGEGEGR